MDEALRRRGRNPESVEDQARLLHERVRAGLLSEQLLQAAAALHYEPAELLRPLTDVCARCGHRMIEHPVSWRVLSGRGAVSTCPGTALTRHFIEPWWHAIHTALTLDQQVTLAQRLVQVWRLEHAHVSRPSLGVSVRHRAAQVNSYVAQARATIEQGEQGWLWLAERHPIPGATVTWLAISVVQHHIADRPHEAGHCSPPTPLRVLREAMQMDWVRASGRDYGAHLCLRDRND